MPTSPVTIAPETFALLQLDAWNALDDGSRISLGRQLAQRLEAHGWGVDEPLALRRFGPTGHEQAVLQWRESRTGLVFSLIPGGTFRPGFDETLMGRYEELRKRLGPNWEPEEEIEEPLGHALPPGSMRACELRQKPPVAIAPLLMAAELVSADVLEIRDLLNLPWISHIHSFYKFLGYNASVGWDKVGDALGRLGWVLPTSPEFEWALRGGVDSLFYWGNEPAEFMTTPWSEADPTSWQASFDGVMSSRFDSDRLRAWPWCNRFGLAAMLAEATWCAPASDTDDTASLLVRGGAANYWGWQSCGEWMLLLNAVESSQDRFGLAHSLRPVVRIEAH